MVWCCDAFRLCLCRGEGSGREREGGGGRGWMRYMRKGIKQKTFLLFYSVESRMDGCSQKPECHIFEMNHLRKNKTQVII